MARRPINRPSSIDQLDPMVRALITELRVDKGWTIDQICDHLRGLDQPVTVSRSAMGRHVRSIADMGAEIRETQAYAEALAREAGNTNQSQMMDLNLQFLQANMFKLMLAVKDGEGIQLSSKEAQEFSGALRNIALTRKTDLEVIEKAEARAALKATKEAAENAVKVARSKGLSKDTVDAIRFAVLGSDA